MNPPRSSIDPLIRDYAIREREDEMFFDVKADLPCCLTESCDAVVVSNRDRYGQPLRTVISKESGLVYTDPRITQEEIKKFYAEDYRKNYKGTIVPKPKHILRAGRLAQDRLSEIRTFLPTGSSILDVGSGGGEFVYTCQNNGYEAHGIEPNRGYANFSIEAYGIDVDCNFFDEVKFDECSLDCITMFHVLEHLEEPVESMRVLSKYLKTQGYFVIEVPNVDYTDTAPNQKWHVGHLYNFNFQTLQAVGLKAGLSPIRTFYSDDGSSLFTVFVKVEKPYDLTLEQVLKGSFDSTCQILRQHTTLSHYLHLHIPIRRCVSKFYRTLNEKMSVRNHFDPKEILDSLSANALV